MCQKIIENVNLLQSYLLILYLYVKTNITMQYLPVYLNNCSYKIIHKQVIDYLGDNCLENKNIRSYKCCIKIELIETKDLSCLT